MVGWIILAVVVVAALLLWKGMRTMWAESTAQVDALPPTSERRNWSAPTMVGERIMWCPILARKVVLADTRIDEGEIGTVVGFTDDKHQPMISFDLRPSEPDTVDKWAGARVLPPALARPKRNPPPSQRSKAKKRRR